MRGAAHEAGAAVVLAHEWAHHVQHLLGWLQWAHSRRYLVGKELQADCYAGAFLRYAVAKAALDDAALDHAVALMVTVGDVGGGRRGAARHGSSTQRQEWFRRGYHTGNPVRCDGVYDVPYARR